MTRIVFDLDGTLIDSAPDIHGIANVLLAGEGLEPISLDQAREFIGNGVGVFVEKMRKARGIADSEQERLTARYIGMYDTAVELTVAYPNVRETLELLHSKGFQLGVCTNKPINPTRAVLRHLGLDHFFDVIIGGDSLPVHKPDPAPLNAAFEALNSGAEIYVGDSEVDAETAQRAAVPFLLYSMGYRKSPLDQIPHSVSFEDYLELPGLIDRLIAEAA